MAYFDTSVIVAYYCPEAFSEKVEKILRKANPPVISPLVEVEIVSALSRKVRLLEISKSDATSILMAFESHKFSGKYSMAVITVNHFSMAASLMKSFEIPLRTLDALHLAVTIEKKIELITSDKQLATAAKLLHTPFTLVE